MARVTAGDGCARDFIYARAERRHTEVPSLAVTFSRTTPSSTPGDPMHPTIPAEPDDTCPRCGAAMQATHHPLCEHRDGTPTQLDDAVVRALVRLDWPA